MTSILKAGWGRLPCASCGRLGESAPLREGAILACGRSAMSLLNPCNFILHPSAAATLQNNLAAMQVDETRNSMRVKLFSDESALATAAADHAAASIRTALREHNSARILVATGTSQFEFLTRLTEAPEIDWQRVEMFHLDEYIGLPISHPASFRKILTERLIQKVGITKYHLLDGDSHPSETIRLVGTALAAAQVDVAFVGIGENGHLAFNDPPADFETEEPYLIVNLDEACRRQQVGEGWFASIADVPKQAISVSLRQILKAKEILVVVPDSRKAPAVSACLEGEISPLAPASILRTHPNATVYLDQYSASLLTKTAQVTA